MHCRILQDLEKPPEHSEFAPSSTIIKFKMLLFPRRWQLCSCFVLQFSASDYTVDQHISLYKNHRLLPESEERNQQN